MRQNVSVVYVEVEGGGIGGRGHVHMAHHTVEESISFQLCAIYTSIQWCS